LNNTDSLYPLLEVLYKQFDTSTTDSVRVFIDSLHKTHQFIDDSAVEVGTCGIDHGM